MEDDLCCPFNLCSWKMEYILDKERKHSQWMLTCLFIIWPVATVGSLCAAGYATKGGFFTYGWFQLLATIVVVTLAMSMTPFYSRSELKTNRLHLFLRVLPTFQSVPLYHWYAFYDVPIFGKAITSILSVGIATGVSIGFSFLWLEPCSLWERG